MKRALILCFCVFAFGLWAQEDDETLPDFDTLPSSGAFQSGDSLFGFRAGGFFPLFCVNPNDWTIGNHNVNIGAAGGLRYQYFVTDSLALGGEFLGSFNTSVNTTNPRTLFMVPLSFVATWMFYKMPFEFPVSLAVGANFISLEDYITVNVTIKPELGIYYRVTPSLSLGLNVEYEFIPQYYYGQSDLDRWGNFLFVGISATYHF